MMTRTALTAAVALSLLAACASQQQPQVAQTEVLQATDASPAASEPAPAAANTAGATKQTAEKANVDEGPAPLKKCSGSMEIAPDGMIDDTEDNNIQVLDLGGRGRGSWSVQIGKKSSATPVEPFRMSEGGANDSKYAARLKGTVAEGDLALLVLKVGYPYDASRYAGITFYARRGEGGIPSWRMRVADKNTWPDGQVCTSCFDDFGSDLYLTTEWKKYTVKFADLTNAGWGKPKMEHLDSSTIYMIAFQSKSPGDFDIWIDDIAFVDCI